MRWIEHINKPLKTLTTVKQVEKFMNKRVKDLEKKPIRTIKVLALFYEPEEFEEEITEFEKAAD